MNDINVLLMAGEDWNLKYAIPEFIKIEFAQVAKVKATHLRDLVILDRDITKIEYEYLRSVTRAHCLYITENAEMTKYTALLNDSKVGKRLYTGDLDAFWIEEARYYYPNPYGEKFNPGFLQVNQMFEGDVEFSGKYDLKLTGDFGDEFVQVAYWKNNIPIFKDQRIDLYLEHETTGDVEIKLRVVQFYNGAIEEIQQVWEFEGYELKNIVRLVNDKNDGPVFASIYAKGSGSLRIISLHDRYSRDKFGYFLPGGKRHVTYSGEEIFEYFDPADMKPPLVVYFSGYRTQEGFEGYYMMRSLGCPALLITDPRLDGGAFYLGDEEYESMMVSIIRKYMKAFNAGPGQVIMTGSSMGTFGAMYYGCDIKPHALVLGKPLANLGTMAKNERIVRVGTFPTALEVLYKEYGALDADAIEKLDKRFWDKFDKADWSKTKLVISYLYEDDYDGEAYSMILSHLNSTGVQVYGKGNHGRHNDNTDQVVIWFKSQIVKLLREDFGRE